MIVCSCSEVETGPGKDTPESRLYFDYQVKGDEGRDWVTVHLRFRAGNSTADPVRIKAPGGVELDGEEMVADSTEFTGVFYEVQKPAAGFSGKHEILFRSASGKEYRETFEFIPFSLAEEIPEQVGRKDLRFRFSGLKERDQLRVILIDTSFSSTDLNEPDSVINGELVIPRDRYLNLAAGPLYIEFHRETTRTLENTPGKGGKLVQDYGLRRQFLLME